MQKEQQCASPEPGGQQRQTAASDLHVGTKTDLWTVPRSHAFTRMRTGTHMNRY